MTYEEKDSVPLALPPGAVSATPEGAQGVAVSTGHADGSGTPMWQQEKQGARCCGFCCDYRRAVLIIACISALFSLGYLIFALVAPDVIPSVGVEYDDDEVEEILEDLVKVGGILAGISLFANICAIIGAIKYNIYLVAVNALWIFGNFVANTITSIEYANDINQTDPDTDLSLVPNIIVSGVIACLLAYPHVGFIVEVKRGIMSFETYPREEYSCCCTPHRH